jgi:hypothetical protein
MRQNTRFIIQKILLKIKKKTPDFSGIFNLETITYLLNYSVCQF